MTTVIRLPNLSAKHVDISVVMTFHHEGLLANYALTAFERVRRAAENEGLCIQMVYVLDMPDEDTQGIVISYSDLSDLDVILKCDNGDLGASRNHGIQYSSGQYIATADGDDYYSKGWLVSAYRKLYYLKRKAVVHPQYVVSFDQVHALDVLFDQSKEIYPYASLFKINPWVSTCFAERSTFIECPYQETNAAKNGYGYEDWHFNLEVLWRDYIHVTADDTALYYRRKKSSLLKSTTSQGAILRPSEFLRNPHKWAAKNAR